MSEKKEIPDTPVSQTDGAEEAAAENNGDQHVSKPVEKKPSVIHVKPREGKKVDPSAHGELADTNGLTVKEVGQRVITAAVILAVLIGGYVALGYEGLRWFALIACTVIAIEAGALDTTSTSSSTRRIAEFVAVLLTLLLLMFAQTVVARLFTSLVGAVWILTLATPLYPKALSYVLRAPVSITKSFAYFSIIGFFAAVQLIPDTAVMLGVETWSLVVLLLALPIVFDVVAWVSGSMLGGVKLAPDISPNKTLSGFVVGVTFAFLVGVAWIALESSVIWMYPLIAVIALTAQMGDLVQSIVKRTAGVKDSGRLLPGHGGVYDRLDSHMAVLPVFMFLVWNIGALV